MSFLREVLAPCRFSFAPSVSALVKPCAVAATYRYVDSRRVSQWLEQWITLCGRSFRVDGTTGADGQSLTSVHKIRTLRLILLRVPV
jgi:hypothetical protein